VAPARLKRVPPSDDAETAVIVPPEAVFPGLRADEAALVELLQGLSRTDTLFLCARANLTVAGAGDLTSKERQQRLLNSLCTPDDIRRINTFGPKTTVTLSLTFCAARYAEAETRVRIGKAHVLRS